MKKCGFGSGKYAKYIKNADFQVLQIQWSMSSLHKSAIFCTFAVFIGFGKLNAECRVRNAECRMQSAECRMNGTQRSKKAPLCKGSCRANARLRDCFFRGFIILQPLRHFPRKMPPPLTQGRRSVSLICALGRRVLVAALALLAKSCAFIQIHFV